ncbi:MAG: hypothetical protein NVS3B25_09990 [Hymenobacter sp.]
MTLFALTTEFVTTTEDAAEAMAARPEAVLMVAAPGVAEVSVAARTSLAVVVSERSNPEAVNFPKLVPPPVL